MTELCRQIISTASGWTRMTSLVVTLHCKNVEKRTGGENSL